MQNLFDKIKIKPNNLDIYNQALTHSSYANEHSHFKNYNMLEFLGDSILQFRVSNFIFRSYPEIEEGQATLLRANSVNTKALEKVAIELNLTKYAKVSKGAANILINPKIQADLVESLIAAIYLDQNEEILEKFLKNFIYVHVIEERKKSFTSLKDPKTIFQEYVQNLSDSPIEYLAKKQENGKYLAKLKYKGQIFGQGLGKSKKEAETEAAKDALKKINI
ncbi:ribonuclease III, partial [Candidatus Mycoplasma pogonae]